MISYKTTDLKLRLFVSLIALVITLICIYFSTAALFQPFFTLLVASVIGFALWEYYQIVKVKGFCPPEFLMILCAFVYVFATYFSMQSITNEFLPIFVLLFSLILLFAYFFLNKENAFLTLSLTAFGFVYVVMTLTTALNIIYFFPDGVSPDGRYYFFYILTVTKITDTGAYFIGKSYGRHQLAPYISPNKTWEGLIGGVALAVLTGMILTSIPYLMEHNAGFLSFSDSFFLCLLIGILAQFGDLSESLIKRDAKVKDSNQLPGLGGVLDIVDSLVFTVPLMYLYLSLQTIQG